MWRWHNRRWHNRRCLGLGRLVQRIRHTGRLIQLRGRPSHALVGQAKRHRFFRSSLAAHFNGGGEIVPHRVELRVHCLDRQAVPNVWCRSRSSGGGGGGGGGGVGGGNGKVKGGRSGRCVGGVRRFAWLSLHGGLQLLIKGAWAKRRITR